MTGATPDARVRRKPAATLHVPHGPGIEIHVRHKPPHDGGAGPAVILMHGSTYPGSTFDLALDGFSWMDHLAAAGYDVYAPDLPGYGLSTRPQLMDQPLESNPPYMTTAEAVAALGAVVDAVCARRRIDRVLLVGWSWGTAITATYTASHPDRVARLVLYAPLWIRAGASLIDMPGPLGAYRVVTRSAAEQRRRAGLTPEQALDLMPTAWFQAWADDVFATDPAGGGESLRAPNGTVADMRAYWASGRATFDPAAIRCPVQVIVGEWDRDTPPALALGLFEKLTSAPWRRLVLIGEGTHSLIIEKNRMQLFRAVVDFLGEPAPY